MSIIIKNILSAFVSASLLPLVPIYSGAAIPERSFVFALDSPYVSKLGQLSLLDYAPFLSNSTTYAPLRFTMEALGANVDYDDDSHTALIEYNGKNYTYPLVYNAVVLDGTSYIPLRNLCEMLGMTVTWRNGLIFLTDEAIEISDEDYEYYSKFLGFSGFVDHGVDYSEPKVKFSTKGGFFTEDLDVELTTELENSTIYYTLDGSDPTPEDIPYTEPIHISDRTNDPSSLDSYITTAPGEEFTNPSEPIFKGTVIKAKAYNDDGSRCSRIYTQSYFVSPNIYDRYGVKLVSLSIPSDYLFNEETGIYVYPNYANTGSDWERNGYMEVFDSDGDKQISQSVGLRINGGYTRQFQQKSLRVYARENVDYNNGDSKKFKYDFFDGDVVDNDNMPINSYKRIILRNSGDDWWKYHLTDPSATAIAHNMGLDTLGYEPCVVFLNGEYWGVHEIRERMDEYYVSSHYGIDNNDVTTAEISSEDSVVDYSSGSKEEVEALHELFYDIANHDMTDAENYAEAEERLDLDNLIDYFIFNIYFENNDWPMNNVKMWKNTNSENEGIDTKWHWVVTDLDGSFESLKNVASIYAGEKALVCWENGTGALGYVLDYTPGILPAVMRSLLNNSEFADKFYNRYMECIDTYFTTEAVQAELNGKYDEIIALRPEHINRYSESWNNTDITPLMRFARTRPAEAKAELNSYFNK